MIQRLRQPYFRQRVRNRIARGLRQYIYVLVVWSTWAISSVILYAFLGELGLFVAMMLFGAIALLSLVYLAQWLRNVVQRDRQWEYGTKKEIEHQIHDFVSPRRPLPPWDAHMASAELLHCLWKLIYEERPDHVMELGSGLSTLVMAYALEACGKGTLTALENHAGYAARTSRQLREHKLDAYAKVALTRFSRLEINCGVPFWYALPDLRAEPLIDLLFIDGPMRDFHPRIRYPALPLLHEYLADNAIVVVDDCHKLDNSTILLDWLAEYPALRIEDEDGLPRFTVLRFSRLAANSGDEASETSPADNPSPAG